MSGAHVSLDGMSASQAIMSLKAQGQSEQIGSPVPSDKIEGVNTKPITAARSLESNSVNPALNEKELEASKTL